jgi:16S rRNA (adenine1518-N6/adenine1519-N6)-dimethyltransferase
VALAAAGPSVLAVEFDRRLVPALEEATVGLPSVRLLQADAMRLDWTAVLGETGPWTLCANLPYNIAVPLVLDTLAEVPAIDRWVVMVQREVGERLAASPGGRDYGAVSVKVAYHGAARVVGAVPRSVFMPPPNVDSVLVEVVRHLAPPVEVPSPDALFVLVRAGFAQRRKMLRGALKPVLGERTTTVLAAAGVDPTARAEALDLTAWSAIARAAA